MSDTREINQASLADSSSAAKSRATNGHKRDDQRSKPESADHPQIVEEHHVVGPHGEDEIEATDDRGRRWYHPRPEPRRRADVLGFNYTWWTVLWIVVIVFAFFPWWW